MGLSYIQVGEINKIELLNNDAVVFNSTDTGKIRQFVSFLLSNSLDDTGQDFKSWNFVKLYNKRGEFYRIEMFEDIFRINGVRFVVGSDVLAKFKAIFGLQ